MRQFGNLFWPRLSAEIVLAFVSVRAAMFFTGSSASSSSLISVWKFMDRNTIPYLWNGKHNSGPRRQRQRVTNLRVMNVKTVLTALLLRDGLSARELSKRTQTNRSTLSSLLSGTNESPRDKTLEPLAKYFDVELAQLRGYKPIPGLLDQSLDESCPILVSSQISNWLENAQTPPGAKFLEPAPGAGPFGHRTFVIKVMDDAMAPYINRGHRVFIDPDFEPDPEVRIALIRVGDDVSLRHESTDLGEKVFTPENASYRTVRDAEVLGYLKAIAQVSIEQRELFLSRLNR